MPRKCDSCLHSSKYPGPRGTVIELCSAPATQLDKRIVTQLGDARVICDREGDGVFVYYQPRHPQAGATFTVEPVQIARRAAA